jgi:predicted alpha/beta superfamily hydrolase
MDVKSNVPESTARPPWSLRGSEYFEIDSSAVGDTMAVGVWQVPEQFHAFYAKANLPMPKPKVVYVLDASIALASAACVCTLQSADIILPGFSPLLLVGLDYVEGRLNARTRDYVPVNAVPESMVQKLEGHPAEFHPGGANRFLEFLETELEPWIRKRYDVDNGPAGILGDSFGGTFVAHSLIQRSKLFDRYWLGSPSLFNTSADLTGRLIQTLSDERNGEKRIFLSLGELEASGGVSFYEEMGANFSRLVAGLEALPSGVVDWQHRIYPGQTHTSVFLPALSDAMNFLYGKRPA